METLVWWNPIREARLGCWRGIFSSSKPQSLLRVLEIHVYCGCNCHWGRLCLWIPPWNSKIVLIYPNGSRFLILLLGRHRLSQQWGPVFTEACFVDSRARTSLGQGEPWCLKAQIFPVGARGYLPTGLKSTWSLMLHFRKNKCFPLSVLRTHSPCLVLWAGAMDGPRWAPWRDRQGWSPSSSHGGPKCYLGMVIA